MAEPDTRRGPAGGLVDHCSAIDAGRLAGRLLIVGLVDSLALGRFQTKMGDETVDDGLAFGLVIGRLSHCLCLGEIVVRRPPLPGCP